jgi:hypothetical protein
VFTRASGFPYPELDESSPHNHIQSSSFSHEFRPKMTCFDLNISKIYFNNVLGLRSGVFLWGFPTKLLYACLIPCLLHVPPISCAMIDHSNTVILIDWSRRSLTDHLRLRTAATNGFIVHEPWWWSRLGKTDSSTRRLWHSYQQRHLVGGMVERWEFCISAWDTSTDL